MIGTVISVVVLGDGVTVVDDMNVQATVASLFLHKSVYVNHGSGLSKNSH